MGPTIMYPKSRSPLASWGDGTGRWINPSEMMPSIMTASNFLSLIKNVEIIAKATARM